MEKGADIQNEVEVYQIYDAFDIALPFTSKVSEILKFDDDIFPITSLEEEDGKDVAELGIFLKSQNSVFNLFDLSDGPPIPLLQNTATKNPPAIIEKAVDLSIVEASQRTTPSTLVERLTSVLRNKESLRFFKTFCFEQFYSIENILFWIEVEAFRSIKDENERIIFAKHILETYVLESAPLSLNLHPDFRQFVSKRSDCSITAFDDLQQFVFILIKQTSYMAFEESEQFQKFIQFKTQDSTTYNDGKTAWEMERYTSLMSETNQSTSNIKMETLKAIHNRYFPDSAQFKQEYFNPVTLQAARRVSKKQRSSKSPSFDMTSTTNTRASIQTREKRLADLHVPNHSVVLSGKDPQEEESATTTTDLRKKAGKLTDFFGKNVNAQDMNQRPSLASTYKSASKSKTNDDEDIYEDDNAINAPDQQFLDSIQENVNKMLGALVDGSLGTDNSDYSELDDLPPEERVILQKRARELALTLQSVKNGKTLSRQGSIQQPQSASSVKDARLEKLFQLTGDITESDLPIEPLSSTSTGQSVLPRKLTNGEKKMYQKKTNKLERLLGNTVPMENLIISQSIPDHELLSPMTPMTPLADVSAPSGSGVNLEASKISQSIEDELDDKHNQIARLRKVQKMLGVHEGETLPKESLKEIQEAISKAADNELERISLVEKVESIKSAAASRKNSTAKKSSSKKIDEKALLQKRAKKLIELLGAVDGSGKAPLAEIQTQLGSVSKASQHLLDDSPISANEKSPSIFDTNEWIEGPDVDQRKKADKLTGFFGYQMSSRQMKLQNLGSDLNNAPTELHKSILWSQENQEKLKELLEEIPKKFGQSSESLAASTIYSQDDLAPSTSKDRSLLQKRSKKLLGILGEIIQETEAISHTHPKAPINDSMDASAAPKKDADDIEKFDTDEWIEGPEVDKKKKADKLTGFFGYQMTTREMKLQKLASELNNAATEIHQSILFSRDDQVKLKELLEDEDNNSKESSDVELEESPSTNDFKQEELPSKEAEATSEPSISIENIALVEEQEESKDIDNSTQEVPNPQLVALQDLPPAKERVSTSAADSLDALFDERYNEVVRLRKIQKMLGVDGNTITKELLTELKDVIQTATKNEEQRISLIHSLNSLDELENEEEKVLSAEEKTILQKRAKKLNELLGANHNQKQSEIILQNQMKIPEHLGSKMASFEDTPVSPVKKDDDTSKFDTNEWIEGPEVDMRKKSDKLAGFFGGMLPSKELKMQKLMYELSTIASGTSDHADDAREGKLSPEQQLLIESIQENARSMLENLENQMNLDDDGEELSQEEKALLQKNARELMGILNAVKEGKPIPTSQAKNQSSLAEARLGKLSHMMGETIDSGKLKVVESMVNEESMLARPLSAEEKRGYQRKSMKLERLLGNSVPADSLITYASKAPIAVDEIAVIEPLEEPSTNAAPISEENDDTDEKNEKKNQMMRLRKLKKRLGIDEGSPLSKEAVVQLEDHINSLASSDADKKKLIEQLNQEAHKSSPLTADPIFSSPSKLAAESSQSASPKQSLLSVVSQAMSRSAAGRNIMSITRRSSKKLDEDELPRPLKIKSNLQAISSASAPDLTSPVSSKSIKNPFF